MNNGRYWGYQQYLRNELVLRNKQASASIFLASQQQNVFIGSTDTKHIGGVLTSCVRFTNMPAVNDGKAATGYILQSIQLRPGTAPSILDLRCSRYITISMKTKSLDKYTQVQQTVHWFCRPRIMSSARSQITQPVYTVELRVRILLSCVFRRACSSAVYFRIFMWRGKYLGYLTRHLSVLLPVWVIFRQAYNYEIWSSHGGEDGVVLGCDYTPCGFVACWPLLIRILLRCHNMKF